MQAKETDGSLPGGKLANAQKPGMARSLDRAGSLSRQPKDTEDKILAVPVPLDKEGELEPAPAPE